MNEREFRLLRRLADELRALRQEIHTIHEEQKSTDSDRNAQPVRTVLIDIPAEPNFHVHVREYYEAENRDRNSLWRRFRPFIELVGVATAFSLGVLTYCTLQEIQKQTPGITKGANAANSSAETAARQLDTIERPWITADNTLAGDLFFDKTGVHLAVKYHLSNIGHSPALDVWTDQTLYLPVNIQKDPEDRRTTLCQQTELRAAGMGQIIFPGGPGLSGTVVTTAGNSEIKRATQYIAFFTPTVVTCVAYHSPLDKSKWHHTGVIMQLNRIDERGMTFGIASGMTVPIKNLQFFISLFRGVIAD